MINQLQQIAATHGGRCLSESYSHAHIKLLWECEKGHQWQALPGNVRQGTWCSQCAKERKSQRVLKELQEIAIGRGGRCLSDQYEHSSSKLLWCCEKGHQWKATPAAIKHGGTWCPHCNNEAKRSYLITIEEVQKIAADRGGRCLSEKYAGGSSKLLWECSAGHHWSAPPGSIANGSWCPKCAGNAKYSIEDMKNVAAKRSGRCLSDTYTNNSTKLIWECSEGHQWEAMPMKVLSGTWCRNCASKHYGASRKLTIEEMGQIATDRGGRCLSDVYVNNRTKLQWQCSEGHIWKSMPADIKKGSWCSECYVSPLTRRKQDRFK